MDNTTPALSVHCFLQCNHHYETNLRFMGPKEEDGILVGRWFDSSFRKFINLKKREGETITNQRNIRSLNLSGNGQNIRTCGLRERMYPYSAPFVHLCFFQSSMDVKEVS